jgi:hypothetical protein
MHNNSLKNWNSRNRNKWNGTGSIEIKFLRIWWNSQITIIKTSLFEKLSVTLRFGKWIVNAIQLQSQSNSKNWFVQILKINGIYLIIVQEEKNAYYFYLIFKKL